MRIGRWTVTLDLADDDGLSISCQAGGGNFSRSFFCASIDDDNKTTQDDDEAAKCRAAAAAMTVALPTDDGANLKRKRGQDHCALPPASASGAKRPRTELRDANKAEEDGEGGEGGEANDDEEDDGDEDHFNGLPAELQEQIFALVPLRQLLESVPDHTTPPTFLARSVTHDRTRPTAHTAHTAHTWQTVECVSDVVLRAGVERLAVAPAPPPPLRPRAAAAPRRARRALPRVGGPLHARATAGRRQRLA